MKSQHKTRLRICPKIVKWVEGVDALARIKLDHVVARAQQLPNGDWRTVVYERRETSDGEEYLYPVFGVEGSEALSTHVFGTLPLLEMSYRLEPRAEIESGLAGGRPGLVDAVRIPVAVERDFDRTAGNTVGRRVIDGG